MHVLLTQEEIEFLVSLLRTQKEHYTLERYELAKDIQEQLELTLKEIELEKEEEKL